MLARFHGLLDACLDALFDSNREDEDSDDDGLSLDEFFQTYEAERAVRRKSSSNGPKNRAAAQAGAHLAELPSALVEHERQKLKWSAAGGGSSPKGRLPEGVPLTTNHFAYRHMWDAQSKYDETEAEIAARKLLQVEAAA